MCITMLQCDQLWNKRSGSEHTFGRFNEIVSVAFDEGFCFTYYQTESTIADLSNSIGHSYPMYTNPGKGFGKM